MSDLVGNPEDRFSRVAAQINNATLPVSRCLPALLVAPRLPVGPKIYKQKNSSQYQIFRKCSHVRFNIAEPPTHHQILSDLDILDKIWHFLFWAKKRKSPGKRKIHNTVMNKYAFLIDSSALCMLTKFETCYIYCTFSLSCL